MMEACRNNRKRHISSQGGHFSSKHVSSFSMLIVKQAYNDTGLTFSKVSLLCCALPRSMNMKCEREKLKREREDNCWCGNISSNSHVQREKSKRREESRRIWPLYLTFDKEGTKRGKDKERDVMEQKGERKCKTSRKKKKKKRGSVTNWRNEKWSYIALWSEFMQTQTYLTDAGLKLWSDGASVLYPSSSGLFL